MTDPDVLLLARAQFGLNIGFHILFPTFTIGLAWLLLFFRLKYETTGDGQWLAIYRLWAKIFALCFAMGVVSGITMSFQFGTNWPGYMLRVGNIAGPLLTFEVLFAFFLEATFLGVMLFGLNRVPARLHIAATALVAVGTTLSAFWILALNSWMHTPLVSRSKTVSSWRTSWLKVIFNPSFPYRLYAHDDRLGTDDRVRDCRSLGVAAIEVARRPRRASYVPDWTCACRRSWLRPKLPSGISTD